MRSERLRECIDNKTLKVATVHSFQGQENDTIILSLCLDGSAKSFAVNENLINVAISRAKDYVFVVANKDSLQVSRKEYIRNLYKGIASRVDANVFVQQDDQLPKFDTLWEENLYDRLKQKILERDLDVKLYGQLSVMNYRLDLTLMSTDGKVLIDIEADGAQHYINGKSIPYDEKRAQDLESIGFKTIRFKNSQIDNNLDQCVEDILQMYEKIREQNAR